MIRVEIGIEINHPAEKTFAFISNFANNPLWQDGMDECIVTTEGALRVGTQYEQKAHFLGRLIRSTFEVKEHVPGKMVKASSIAGSFPITFTRIVEGDDKISRVHAIVEGDPSGFFKFAGPLMKLVVSRSVQRDYRKLKQILEEK